MECTGPELPEKWCLVIGGSAEAALLLAKECSDVVLLEADMFRESSLTEEA